MSSAFLDHLLSYQMPIQLVLDGAIIDNIEGLLGTFKLSGRPLFRETADIEILHAGPWLIAPATDEGMAERCLAAARCAGKGVFWLGECEADAMYRHLRRLNAARMPDGRILYFRHYDSDVLAAASPLLNKEQAAFLFGPAYLIAFVGGEGNLATVQKPDNLPPPGAGPISFEAWQIDKLNERQRRLFTQSLTISMRSAFGERIAGLSDDELQKTIEQRVQEANSLGIYSKNGLQRWAFLCIHTDNAASNNSIIKTYIQRNGLDRTDETFQQSLNEILEDYDRATRHWR